MFGRIIAVSTLFAVACGAPQQPSQAAEPVATAPTATPAAKTAPAAKPDTAIPPRKDDKGRASKSGTTKTALPRGSKANGPVNVEVHYGRPSMKGRTVWGELIPHGAVWRTGADEATTITFSDGVLFGDKPVDAGTYALFTIPNEKSWTLILNSTAAQWGAYDYDASKDVARIDVTPTKHDATEVFTIAEAKGGLALQWANLSVPVPLGTP